MTCDSLFSNIPEQLPDELVEVLASGEGCRVERIVSRGHASSAGFWYEQPQDEFVVLLKGGAGLRFEDEPACRTLKPGDYVNIPAHRRHRVEWTEEGAETVWLAVHYKAEGGGRKDEG